MSGNTQQSSLLNFFGEGERKQATNSRSPTRDKPTRRRRSTTTPGTSPPKSSTSGDVTPAELAAIRELEKKDSAKRSTYRRSNDNDNTGLYIRPNNLKLCDL